MPFLQNFDDTKAGAGHFLIGENDPNLSNESITLAPTGVDLLAGTILGKITASGLYVPINPAAADGSQNFAGILYGRRDTNASNQRATAVVRRQVVNSNLLTYVNAANAAQKTAIEAQAAAAMVMFRK